MQIVFGREKTKILKIIKILKAIMFLETEANRDCFAGNLEKINRTIMNRDKEKVEEGGILFG